jgi:aspartate/methionine/tyrosine aminotransferase
MTELPPLAPAIEALEISRIAQVFELGFGRENLIPLWVGEGDLPTPAFICDAATAAMQAGKTYYTQKRGIPELRQAIADYTNGLYGTAAEAERFIVTSSGMNGIMMALQAILTPGDNVVVVSPVWPNIVSSIRIVGGVDKPVCLDPLPDGGFSLDLARLAAAIDDRTRAIFIASPGNPTGWVMDADQQRQVLDLCRERGLWMLADEAYARFIYDSAASNRTVAPSFHEVAAADDPLIVINTFSKTWAMTGWRMGWLTVPAQFSPVLDKLIEFNTSGAPHFLQYACITAIREGEPFVSEMVERCRRGGALVFDRLSELPNIRIARPHGSFYSFFAVEGLQDSLAYAKRLLNETDVGLAPGSAFGPGGEGHMRLCFASSAEKITKALDRLVPALAKGV